MTTSTMNMSKKIVLVLILIGLMAFLPGLMPGQSGRDVEIRASISADKIGKDDVLVYTFTLKGIAKPQQPKVSHFKDFNVRGPSYRTEFVEVNGVFTSSVNYMFYLIPLKTGKLTIPSVTYKHEGKEYRTQSFTVEVVRGSLAPSQPQRTRPRNWPFDRDEDDFFAPLREKRAYFLNNPNEVDDIISSGINKARTVAQETMHDVYTAMKMGA